jgi:hypothetical protein
MGESLLSRVLHGASDGNVRFGELRMALLRLGFAERVKGSHHIFTKDGVGEILNLQPRGSFAKPYQVKQVRRVLVRYRLVAGAE